MNERKPNDRRIALRREQDLIRRLADVEELARANRRELELQFRRIADMQVDIDRLLKWQHRNGAMPPAPELPTGD